MRDDIDRLHVSRKDGGRDFPSIEDCIDASIHKLENSKSKENLFTAANYSKGNRRTDRTTTKTRK